MLTNLLQDIAEMLKAVFAERTRIWLTILAIAWGTVSISIMLAIGEGLRQAFGDKFKEVGNGIVVLKPGMSIHPHRGQPPQILQFNLQDITKLGQIPGILQITPEYAAPSNLRLENGEQKYPAPILGVKTGYAKLRNIKPRPPGRFIDPIDEHQHHLVMVLGADVAKQLKVREQQTVRVNGLPFTIIGILDSKVQPFFYLLPDNNLVWVPAATARVLWGEDLASLILKTETQIDRRLLKAQIRQTLALPRGLDAAEENILHIVDAYEIQQKVDKFLFGMEIFLGLAGALTLVVAGVGIANVMFASVTTMTREIGIRKALGAQKGQILRYYVYQAILITALGGTIGLVVTSGLTWVLNQLLLNGSLVADVGRLHLALSSTVIVVIVSVLGLVGLIAGIFPARRAASVDPVVALRSA